MKKLNFALFFTFVLLFLSFFFVSASKVHATTTSTIFETGDGSTGAAHYTTFPYGSRGGSTSQSDHVAVSFSPTSTATLSSIYLNINYWNVLSYPSVQNDTLKVCVVPDNSGEPLYTSSTAPSADCRSFSTNNSNGSQTYATVNFSPDNIFNVSFDDLTKNSWSLYSETAKQNITLTGGETYWVLVSLDPISDQTALRMESFSGGSSPFATEKYYASGAWNNITTYTHTTLLVEGSDIPSGGGGGTDPSVVWVFPVNGTHTIPFDLLTTRFENLTATHTYQAWATYTWGNTSDIPYNFGTPLAWGSTANYFISEGMVNEAAVMEQKYELAREQEYDKATRQQGQITRLNMVKTY